MRRAARTAAVAVLVATVGAACTSASGLDTSAPARLDASRAATTTTAPPTTTTTTPAPTTSTSTTPTTTSTSTTTTPPRPRVVHDTAWAPFASAGPVVLLHPAARVERIGLHEANHDGAQTLAVLPGAAAAVVLEARERGTQGATAADVVVDPAGEIRSPVTGRVKRAGTYTLYCRHRDDFVVVEPDARPGWEVKVLHIDGVRVRPGDRVVAGETVIAPRATQLPFESQVDELRTAEPAWPHVHVEVVDLSIRDRPNPNSGC